MADLTVIIPSRTQPEQARMLRRAMASVRAQTVSSSIDIRMVVCVDLGSVLSLQEPNVTVVQSEGTSQAAALNAGVRCLNTEFVAFLEDDDEWTPRFLEVALTALKAFDFVSSTELELRDDGEVIKILDFPTPSGWVMPGETLRAVGEFSEDYRLHLDNEWLGRLVEREIKRVHLVECSAPIDFDSAALVRPRLADILQRGGPLVKFLRHDSPLPLIRRYVHPASGMQQIATRSEFQLRSQQERTALQERFGRIPI